MAEGAHLFVRVSPKGDTEFKGKCSYCGRVVTGMEELRVALMMNDCPGGKGQDEVVVEALRG